MNKRYETPDMEIIDLFDVDIVTASDELTFDDGVGNIGGEYQTNVE